MTMAPWCRLNLAPIRPMLPVRKMFGLSSPFLKRMRSASTGDAPEGVAPVGGRGERIAIIDDEEVMISVAKSVLKKLGYTTSTYDSASEFLSAYVERPDHVDLVLTDVVMPGMTGLQLAKQLRDTGHVVPILLMTGFSVRPKLEAGTSPGRISCVRKPVSPVHLGQAVRRLLSN